MAITQGIVAIKDASISWVDYFYPTVYTEGEALIAANNKFDEIYETVALAQADLTTQDGDLIVRGIGQELLFSDFTGNENGFELDDTIWSTKPLIDELLTKALNIALKYQKALPNVQIGSTASYDHLVSSLDPILPEEGETPEIGIQKLFNGVENGLIHSTNSRYFGFVIGGSTPWCSFFPSETLLM